MVSNHPNMLIDPFNAGMTSLRILHFFANASLFKHPFTRWFFNTFYCFPIERPQDIKGQNRRINNIDSFRAGIEFIQGGGMLFAAPEGGSEPVWRLRPLKTGTGRVGLSVLSEDGWKSDLKIVPVGITYTQPGKFQSEVLVKVGEPFSINDYAERAQEDFYQAARSWTAKLAEHMQQLLMHTNSDELELTFRKVDHFLQEKNFLKVDQRFERNKRVTKAINQLAESNPEQIEALDEQLGQYQSTLKTKKTSAKAVEQKKTNSSSLFSKMILLILGFPFWLYAYLNNGLACYLPHWINKASGIESGYTDTVRIMVGIVIFAIIYPIQINLFHQHLADGVIWITLFYVLSLYPIGLVAKAYERLAQNVWHHLSLRSVDFGTLSAQHDEVYGLIDRLVSAEGRVISSANA